MADQSVVTELLLNASQFIAEAQRAAQAAEKVSRKSEETTGKSSSGWQKFTSKVNENRQALTTVGAGMAAVGVVTTGLALKVAKVGVEYNVLQQTSRAALKTLMGSAEAANAQMDKLDAFAKTSPFSKAVFIDAQRQMLGFGIEAKRVVPYLDAIQNAVAAMGGSNNDIAEITEIMAKIKSSSKITATSLMEFGKRGLDAATLIGDAMGKTGAQIRAEITAGTLGADEALDALAQGMQNRFGGAAAGIKDTFVGAMDRVKAAFRDFSSSAMDPFVGKEGGGLFVGWLNTAADMIRLLDKLPGPVKTATVTLGGLGGVALTAGGGFLMLGPRILDTLAASQSLATQMPRTTAVMKALGKAGGAIGGALAVATVAFSIYSAKAADAASRTDQYVAAMQAASGSAESLEQAQRATTREMAAMSKLDWGWMQKMTTHADSIPQALDNIGVSLSDFVDAVHGSDSEFDAFIETLNRGAAGAETSTLMSTFQEIAAKAQQARKSVADSTEAYDANAGAAEAAGEANEGAADGFDDAADSARGYLDVLKDIVDFERDRVNQAMDLHQAENKYAETLAGVSEILEKNGATLDVNTEAGRANREMLIDLATNGQSVVDAMVAMTDANGNATYSVDEVRGQMQSARDQFIETATALGLNATEAAALADEYGLIPERVATDILVENQARDEVRELLAEYGEIPEELVTIIAAMDDSSAVIDAVAQALDAGVPPERIIDLIAYDGVSVPADAAARVIEAIPNEWVSNLIGRDGTSAPAKTAKGNTESIPRQWNTNLRADDQSTPKSRSAKTAAEAIPTARHTNLTATDNASGVFRNVKSLVDLIPSFKQVTVSAVQTGSMRALGRAHGGPVFGPGTWTSDSIPAMLSNQEHVWTAREVWNLGGHGNMFALRAMARNNPRALRDLMGFAGGGTPSGYPVYVPSPAVAPVVQRVPAPQIVKPNVMVQAIVENPFTGAEVEARVAKTIVKYV